MTPHPLTIVSIQLHGGFEFKYDLVLTAPCGCERAGRHYRLCAYHQGYNDALDVAGVPE